MQFTKLITAVLLSMAGIAVANEPPYCTPTGAGVCNLGYEYEISGGSGDHIAKVWLYDNNCDQIYYNAFGPGIIQGSTITVDSPLSCQVILGPINDYPVFWYAGGYYTACSCYDGETYDTGSRLGEQTATACQCAFDCTAVCHF